MVRKVLIADPDLDSVRALSRALREKGYQVHYAPDGSKALELAVLRHPDLTLFDDACQLIEARTFVQILKTNPRTEDIPVVLTTTTFDADKVRGFRDGYLRKPFNLDEVVSRMEQVFRRSDAARELRGEAKEIEGSLSQFSLPDLLQILAVNRRTGRLSLTRGAERGELSLNEGRPVNAKTSGVEGEKALFRLLSWRDGTFAFTPGPAAPRVLIHRSMEDALLEGMRHADESARLLGQLPPLHSRLVLAADAQLAADLHPVTAQVVELIAQPRALGEVLDLAPANDLDLLSALGVLLQKGLATVAEDDAGHGREPILGAADIHALRGQLFRGRGAPRLAVAKVFLCGSPQAARKLLRGLSGISTAGAEPGALRSGFGTLGQLDVGENLRVDFCILPAADAARPLWHPFSAGAAGALLTDVTPLGVALAKMFAFDLQVPVVSVGLPLPPELLPAGAQCAQVEEDWVHAVRQLLLLKVQATAAAQAAKAPGGSLAEDRVGAASG